MNTPSDTQPVADDNSNELVVLYRIMIDYSRTTGQSVFVLVAVPESGYVWVGTKDGLSAILGYDAWSVGGYVKVVFASVQARNNVEAEWAKTSLTTDDGNDPEERAIIREMREMRGEWEMRMRSRRGEMSGAPPMMLNAQELKSSMEVIDDEPLGDNDEPKEEV